MQLVCDAQGLLLCIRLGFIEKFQTSRRRDLRKVTLKLTKISKNGQNYQLWGFTIAPFFIQLSWKFVDMLPISRNINVQNFVELSQKMRAQCTCKFLRVNNNGKLQKNTVTLFLIKSSWKFVGMLSVTSTTCVHSLERCRWLRRAHCTCISCHFWPSIVPLF